MTHDAPSKNNPVGKIIRKLCLSLTLVLLVALPIKAQSNRIPLIAAASDLQFALTDIVAMFQSQTGHKKTHISLTNAGLQF